MWVYQQPKKPEENDLPVQALELCPVLPAGQATEDVIPEETLPAAAPAEPRPEVPPGTVHRYTPPRREVLLLAAAYLFGTFLSGIAAALCKDGETEVLQYYLGRWQQQFSAQSAADAVGLFRTELLTTSGVLAGMLLLGLSALGPIPIFLFTILYGAGSGLLSSQLLSGVELKTATVFLGICGIPTALYAGGLCRFGASALQVSSRLCAYTFGRCGQAPGAHALFRQFFRAMFLLLPLCGIAAAAVYLAGQMKLS